MASGELGEIIGFRGIHAEDYMADPAVPHSFRTDPGSGGALADLGSHIIAMARYLLGPVEAVCGALSAVHRMRPDSARDARQRPVAVDDHAIFLGRFTNGMVGSFEACWAAAGRKVQLAFEITGTRGSLAFTQERVNELRHASRTSPHGKPASRRSKPGRLIRPMEPSARLRATTSASTTSRSSKVPCC